MPHSIDECSEIPTQLVFTKETFSLAGFIISNAEEGKNYNFHNIINYYIFNKFFITEHFYSFVKRRGILMKYDGMGHGGDLFQFVKPNEVRNSLGK